MLCLTRKVGQSIRIGDAVITVLRSKGKTVRIGIDAPKTTSIARTEVDNIHLSDLIGMAISEPPTLGEIRDAHNKGASE